MFSSTLSLHHVFRRSLANLIGAALVLMATLAWADDYTDVSRLIRAGQLVEAQTKADLFLSTKPKDPQMRFLKGVILNERGKPLDAIAVFTKLTQDYPELPEPHNNLAVLYASQNQYDKAKASLEAAIKTNPSYSTAHENLGDVYAKLASIAYGKALQLDGGNPAVPPKLALIKEIFTTNKAVATAPASTVAANVPSNAANAAKPSTTPSTPVPPVQVAINKTPPAAVVTPAVTPPAAAAKPSPAVAPVIAPPVVPAVPAAAAPAGKPAPVDNDADAKQKAEDAVKAWATAWSGKDLKRYFAAYGSAFDPPGNMSRSAWEEERKVRIQGKSRISVKISALQTTVSGKTAVVKFRQDYQADALVVSSRKTLTLTKVGERWVITKEAAA
jgi:tetratricopeptide (TPR) repeat protein